MMDFSAFTADGTQKDNIAGIRRFWKVITKVFTGEFPAKAHVVNGQVTADALAFLPQYHVAAEYILPNDTKNFDYELAGAEGSESWKHTIGYEMAGFSAAMVAEMMKDQNARSVYFVEDTDGNIVVVGTSVKGLKVTTQGGSGKQGGEKRGAVMAGEEVGYRWAPVPLSSNSKNLWLARQKGYLITYIGLGKPVTFVVGGERPDPTKTLLVDDVRAFKIGDPVEVQVVKGFAYLPGVMGTGTITNIVGNNMTITLTTTGVGFGNPITSNEFRITLYV